VASGGGSGGGGACGDAGGGGGGSMTCVCGCLCVVCVVEGGRSEAVSSSVVKALMMMFAAGLSFANAKEEDKVHPTGLHIYLRQLHGKQVVCAWVWLTYNGLGRDRDRAKAGRANTTKKR